MSDKKPKIKKAQDFPKELQEQIAKGLPPMEEDALVKRARELLGEDPGKFETQ